MLNMMAGVRTMLRELGARRLSRIASKKEVERMRSTDIRMGMTTTNFMVVVPRGNKLFHRFLNEELKPTNNRWRFELRSNPDLKGDPLLFLVEVKVESGAPRSKGIYAPGYNKNTDAAFFAIPTKAVEAIKNKFGEFRTTPVKVRHATHHGIEIELPSTKLPPKQVFKPIPKPTAIEVMSEVIREPEPEPVTIAPATVTPQAPIQFPRRVVLEPVQAPMDVEKCIDFLNKMKEKKGNDLRFTIEEHGYLSFIMKGGKR